VFEVPGIGTVEILETALTGMYLVEAIVGAGRLIVLDSVVSGTAAPGTVRELTERDLAGARGGSPHGIGLLEALDLARALGLQAPVDVRFVTVEAGDSVTIGGAMTARVSEAVDLVVDRAIAIIGQGRSGALPMVQ